MGVSNNVTIVDSSGMVSLVVETDSNHTAAVAAVNRLIGARTEAAVLSEVFETLNILGKKFFHQRLQRPYSRVFWSPQPWS
jgi:hypothetical protein